MSRSTSMMLLALTLLFVARAADAALTTGQCLVLKRQAWGNLRKCEATEQVKQLKGKPADLAKCQTKFQEKLAKTTAKATAAAIACRYGDNGDGTVTDYDTGLQWERKTGVPGGFCVLGPHCVNNEYTWDEANSFVGTSADGSTFTTCFSGHCDWRLPTIVELQTILLEPFPCGTIPCIDPVFGPTATLNYWSATSLGSAQAWTVYFDNGSFYANVKANSYYVRAVRAGL